MYLILERKQEIRDMDAVHDFHTFYKYKNFKDLCS